MSAWLQPIRAQRPALWTFVAIWGASALWLAALWGSGWGVVLSSLTFGVWHLGLGFTQTGGHGLLDGFASTVLLQATMGIAFGVIYHRTRNLLAGSIVHVVSNSMG